MSELEKYEYECLKRGGVFFNPSWIRIWAYIDLKEKDKIFDIIQSGEWNGYKFDAWKAEVYYGGEFFGIRIPLGTMSKDEQYEFVQKLIDALENEEFIDFSWEI